MKYFFTSDYHLGHGRIIDYCDRPFKSLEHMNESIIRNHNSRVKPDDIVFHLGDFCFRNVTDVRGEGIRKSSAEWEARLNGKIIHIRGNHDRNNSTKTIIQGLLIEHCGRKVYCVHKPEHHSPLYDINFVGHVHNNWSIKIKGDVIYDYDGRVLYACSNLINVGVDVNRFMPQAFDELIKKWREHEKTYKET